MRLARVEISDYRSIFADERATSLGLDLAEGMNALVGINNCGKSNVLRAIALALDPHYPFDPAVDNPGPRPFAHPIIRLHFTAEGRGETDQDLLAAAKAYETSVGSVASHAAEGRVILQVSFEPVDEGVHRRELLVTPSGHVPVASEAQRLMDAALHRLRESVRFVMISSGESIRSVLDGNFREILHSVVRERLADAFADAEASRNDYLAGIQDSLLGPLRDRLVTDIGALFPEIHAADLVPEVPTIDRTLSNVRVGLKDLVSTPLSEKGTGVRGGVLVAMLSYLASNATRGMIFAVEEPEAFLHPAAQEDLRDQIEEIALGDDITLLVTTHSPYIVSRSERGRVFGLAKDRAGRTRIGSVMSGNGEHSAIVSSLFRESTFEDLVRRAASFPPHTDAVLLVEGDGDKKALTLAADVVGRPELLDGIHIVPTGGTIAMVPAAVLARASTEKPVLIVVDNDEPGRKARETLTGRTFDFKKSHVISYASLFPQQYMQFPVEAEDLFGVELIEAFVELHGPDVVDGTRRRPDGAFHYDFGQGAKELLDQYLMNAARPNDVSLWIDLILKLRELAGFESMDESTEEIIAGAEEASVDDIPVEGLALIVTGKLDYARYQRSSVLLLDTNAPIPQDLTHVGFYLDAEIKPEFAEVLQHYPSLRFSSETVEQLRTTGNVRDQDVSAVIARSLEVDDDLAGKTLQLLLLSGLGDDRTFLLDHPIKNTKEKGGKPLAWTIAPKLIPMEAISIGPLTTTELDEYTQNSPPMPLVEGARTNPPVSLSRESLRSMYYPDLLEAARHAWDDGAVLEMIRQEAAQRVGRNRKSKAIEVLDLVTERLEKIKVQKETVQE